MPSPELTTIQARVIKETEKGLYVYLDALDVETWLPKSQIEVNNDFDPPKITLPYWLAKEKGLV